jgi:hypothetical protein
VYLVFESIAVAVHRTVGPIEITLGKHRSGPNLPDRTLLANVPNMGCPNRVHRDANGHI